MKVPAVKTARAKRRPRPTVRMASLVCLSIAIALLMVAPIVLVFNGSDVDLQLARVGNLGQAYGLVSAVLSALALGGIAASIYYQAKQGRGYRVEAWQRVHFDVMRLLLAEPSTYLPCIIDPTEFDSEEQIRQYFFTSMWLAYGRTGLELGIMSEEGVRSEFVADMCRSELARELWNMRRGYLQNQVDIDRFTALVDNEFRKTAVSESATSSPNGTPSPDQNGRDES